MASAMKGAGKTDRDQAPGFVPAEGEILRPALDALELGIGLFDAELTLVFCNTAFRTLRDYPAELSQCGCPLAGLFRHNADNGDYGPGDSEDHVALRVERARSREPVALEYELARGRILKVRYYPIQPDALLLSYEDVTELRRAEAALRESKERYQLAMSGAKEGMWDWTKGSNEIVVSNSYKRLIGFDFEGDTMPLEKWNSLIHPDDLAGHDEARSKHFRGETDIYECEYRVKCEDGEYRWFHDRARSIRNEDGEVYRMAGSMTDITARKLAEWQLLEAHQKIKHQNKTLEDLSAKLSRYLSPQIYASIFSGEQSAELSSKRKLLTVCFSDIVNFTGITEELEPEELTQLLNSYLSEMTGIALDHGGTIDKYVGDAIIVFFGDPESRGANDDAIACVSMAVAMQQRMQAIYSDWRGMGLDSPFQVRIGICTGYCTVGNFGSDDRMAYTIIGHPVNLAARLQAHSDIGGVLISNKTRALIGDRFRTEEQAALQVKGFAKPMRTHKLRFAEPSEDPAGVFRRSAEGINIVVDLNKQEKSEAIRELNATIKSLRRHRNSG